VVAVLESVLTEYSRLGVVRERTGNILPGIAPSNLYPTAEGSWVVIGANADSVFARLCRAMGRPALAQDPRYATHTARGERRALRAVPAAERADSGRR
jgi:crotonobetainyl-CoA:carnitine CoA-transferase CaiB-like acyl-CoA transferase